MPIVIPKEIPAYETLIHEKIFVMNESRASEQDIRPIEILILNLMPTKIVTETQLMRLLSNSPLQINVTLMSTESYVGTNTPLEHLEKFYKPFSEIKLNKYDGMIITGAPVENLSFKDVKYWDELCEIFDFAKNNVTSTLFICWGAQAGLNYYYGINKKPLNEKLFGVFSHKKLKEHEHLLKGLDDVFYMPHSRHTTISPEDIIKEDKLELLSCSDEAGASIIKSKDNKFFFITGHAEYDRDTLEKEYLRDLKKGLPIEKPKNYYIGDTNQINMCWSSAANLIYVNWLNYYVYQVTPFNLD